MKPGTYAIKEIHYRDPWAGEYYFLPQIAFRIPESGASYYIGTLMVDFAIERGTLGGIAGSKAIFNIVDEYDLAAVSL